MADGVRRCSKMAALLSSSSSIIHFNAIAVCRGSDPQPARTQPKMSWRNWTSVQSRTLDARQPGSLDRCPVLSRVRKWKGPLDACVIIGTGPQEPDGQNAGNQLIVPPDHGLLQGRTSWLG
ncbi:hypothetical protein BDW75DRAFT_160841 [Aspergillus navahoensis]